MRIEGEEKQVMTLKGVAAITIGKYWVGVTPNNQYCKKRRRTADKAIQDAITSSYSD